MSIPSRNVAFTKPDEPAFLKKFKAKVGYKEPATIEDKRERLKTELERAKEDDGDEVEREDEQPTVVVLKAGDIGPEEFQAYRQQMKGNLGKDGELSAPTVELPPGRHGDDSSAADTDKDGGKILFRKPTKRKSSEGRGGEERGGGGGGVLDATTSKKPRQDIGADKAHLHGHGSSSGRRRRRSSGGESQSKGVKNKSLLSFGDDEEEDED